MDGRLSLALRLLLLIVKLIVIYDNEAVMLDHRRPKMVRCKGCKKRIKVKRKGRVPIYCGQACKQLAYLKRRLTGPSLLLAQDLATEAVRTLIRREVLTVLKQAGLVPENLALPSQPARKKPSLRLVVTEQDGNGQ